MQKRAFLECVKAGTMAQKLENISCAEGRLEPRVAGIEQMRRRFENI